MKRFIELCSETLCDEERQKKIISLFENGQLDPTTKDGRNGWSPIHFAAKFGRASIVDLLVSHNSCDPHLQTKDKKYTALHIASKYNQLEVVEALLKYTANGEAPKQDREGNTPLHAACKSGSLDIVNRLTRKYSTNSIQQVNRDGATPLGIAVTSWQTNIAKYIMCHEQAVGNPASTFPDFRNLFPQFHHKQSLDHPVNIFVMGNRHTGKSTLIKSIQTQGAIKLAIGAFIPTSGVEHHIGGVVPRDVSSDTYGRVKFFELAGCQQSTHENIFSAIHESGNAVFLITLSFKEEMKKMEATLLYWLCFIHHQLQSMGRNVMPYIVVVGSFLFYYKFGSVRLDNRHRLHLVYHRVIAAHSELCGHFHFIGKFSMDCRRSESPGMRQLKRVLQRKSHELRLSGGKATVPSLCYVLLSALHVMRPEKSDLPIVRLSEIKHKSSLTSPLTLFDLLPSELENLCPFLNKLEERKAVVILHHLDRQDPWVLFDEFRLTSKINDTLIHRALQLSVSSPAIMNEEKLYHCFSSLSTSLDINVLLNILNRFKITEVMACENDTRYFLPSLLKFSPVTDSTISHSWNAPDSKYTFGFGQCIVPDPKQMIPFFMPRFLYFMLYEFFTMTESGEFDHVIMSHSALHLSLDPQLEIYITVDSSSIILYMRCSESGVFSCLQYRKKIVAVIHQQKGLLQPNVNVLDYIVPLEKLTFPFMNIRQIIANGILVSDFKKQLTKTFSAGTATDSMTRLRSFEPYRWLSCLQKTHLDNLLDHKHINVEVSRAFIRDLASCVGEKWEQMLEYSEIFNPDSSSEGLELNSNSTNVSSQQFMCTYSALLEYFSSISIFQSTSELIAILKTPMKSNFSSSDSAATADNQLSDLSDSPLVSATNETVVNVKSISDVPRSSSAPMSYSRSGLPHMYTPFKLHASKLSDLGASVSTLSSESEKMHQGSNFSETEIDISDDSSIDEDHYQVIVSKGAANDPKVDDTAGEGKITVPYLQAVDTKIPRSEIPQGVQFITNFMVIKCSKKGGKYNNKDHNITLIIPPQQIQEDIDIEFAVALVGTYTFPESLTPVSPILWVRLRQENGLKKLCKPVEISIPHAVNCGQNTKLLHMLRSHGSSDKYDFKKIYRKSNIQPYKGTTSTNLSRQQYFFCIAASTSNGVIAMTEYFLIKVAPMPVYISNDLWKVYFFVTYALPTYVEMVRQQFGENYTVDERRFYFDTKEEPCIRVKYMRETPELWSLTNEGTYRQIEASKVDLENGDVNIINRLHTYPPNFTIAFNGSCATGSSVVEFEFEGVAHSNLLYEMVLHVLKPSSKSDGIEVAALLNICPTAEELEHIISSRIIKVKSISPWWQRVGQHLKISLDVLDAIQSTSHQSHEFCLKLLFQHWLKGAGMQPATWSVLLEALEDSGFYTLAETVKNNLSLIYNTSEEEGVSLSSTPQLCQLKQLQTTDGQKIEIMKCVSPAWRKIRDHLKLDKIVKGDMNDESCCQTMLQWWLRGNGVQPVSWNTLLDIFKKCNFDDLVVQIRTFLKYQFSYPEIHGADIVARTRIRITPGKPLTYRWERHGFQVHFPANAISDDVGPVTLSIQASLSGDYQLPDDDHVLVSGVYWLALQPPLKFAKKVTVTIQHCASVSDADSSLSFITAMCTQKTRPYTFKALLGEIFSDSDTATIQVSHFSALAVSSPQKSKYTICSYYIPKQHTIWEVHITVTPKEDLMIEKVKEVYTRTKSAEEGPSEPTVKFYGNEILLDSPDEPWEKNGWTLCPLSSLSILKESVDEYEGGPIVPAFKIKLTMNTSTQCLQQKVMFLGVEPKERWIMITRDPPEKINAHETALATASASQVTPNVEPTPTLPKLVRLKLCQEVGASYATFGILILNDIIGSRISSFERACQDNPERVMMRILQEWLEGKGIPVTWESLIKTLRDIGLSALADQILSKHI